MGRFTKIRSAAKGPNDDAPAPRPEPRKPVKKEPDVSVEIGQPEDFREGGKPPVRQRYYVPNPDAPGQLSNVGEQEFEEYKSFIAKQKALEALRSKWEADGMAPPEEVRKRFAKRKPSAKREPDRLEED